MCLPKKTAVSSKKLHLLLENRLDNLDEDLEEDTVNDRIETNEDKAKRLIKEWADKGFLTNYQSESGEIIYELSSYASKAIDWVAGLKKEDYIGTESKFKAIFSQLKELVEFTNEDRENYFPPIKSITFLTPHSIFFLYLCIHNHSDHSVIPFNTYVFLQQNKEFVLKREAARKECSALT